jgi:signal transduction histidine kinase
VHRIVSDHGGTVDVTSVPGEGTRVEVRIPWEAGEHRPVARANA